MKNMTSLVKIFAFAMVIAIFSCSNGSTSEHDLLVKLIELCGQANIAGDAILKRFSKNG